ncbi:MAG: RHS repeat-associated core domain-containing protein [Chitinophagaceae bacterium]|nr:MAG: RHS repeat-associated core domain-containing protein [Chitinophagaceae bacterium]
MINSWVEKYITNDENTHYATTAPKAFLNYVAFDDQMNMNSANSGVVQVPTITGSEQAQPLVAPEQIIQKNGYLYIYVSNESAQKVFFDNLVIHHNKGHLLEEDQYYPFGLRMAGISDEALPEVPNNYLYNGKELQQNELSDGSSVGWYDYGFRNYDPQLGKFIEQDPLTDELATVSSYQYALNDPVANIDEDGLAGLPVVTITAQAVNRMSAFSSFTSAIIGVAPLVGNVTSLTVHAMQIGGTVINGLSVTKGVGNASWPPWKGIHSILQGLWYNFEGNMTQAISSEAETGVGLARDVQQKVYDYRHFNQGSTKDKIYLIGSTIQIVGAFAFPEDDPEGMASESGDLGQEVRSAGEGMEETENVAKEANEIGNRIKANSLKEFKSLVQQLSKPGSQLTKTELEQFEKLTERFGGKLRYDLNPVKGKILRPHVQVEGLGSKIASRHIWLGEGAY